MKSTPASIIIDGTDLMDSALTHLTTILYRTHARNTSGFGIGWLDQPKIHIIVNGELDDSFCVEGVLIKDCEIRTVVCVRYGDDSTQWVIAHSDQCGIFNVTQRLFESDQYGPTLKEIAEASPD